MDYDKNIKKREQFFFLLFEILPISDSREKRDLWSHAGLGNGAIAGMEKEAKTASPNTQKSATCNERKN